MLGAIVGFGAIARGHLHGYRGCPDLDVAAVVDTSAQRRGIAVREHGLRAYADLDTLCRSERVDFLDICTPPSSHLTYVEEALRRGLPAMCEKPVFVPGEQGYDELLDRIAASGVVVYPCTNYKFAPVFSHVRALIADGALGDVRHVRVRILRPGHARGVPEWHPHWRRDPAVAAGGILRDHGPHSLYLATGLAGLEPVAVSCLAGRMAANQDSGYEGEQVEDTVLVRILCSAGEEIELSLSWAGTYRDSHYVFGGTRNTVIVHNDELTFTDAGSPMIVTTTSGFDDPSHAAWFAAMFCDFADVLRRDDAVARAGQLLREAVVSSRVIDAGYASARQGGAWIDVDTTLRPGCSGETVMAAAGEQSGIPAADGDVLAALRHRYRDRAVALATGCFDLLHVGHLHFLAQARAQADVLVVAVNSDASIRRLKGEARPLVPEEERLAMVSALRCVDHALLCDDDVADVLIRRLRPDVFVTAAPSVAAYPSEQACAHAVGARVHLVERPADGPSTTSLLDLARTRR